MCQKRTNRHDTAGHSTCAPKPWEKGNTWSQVLSVRIQLANVGVTHRHANMFPAVNWFLSKTTSLWLKSMFLVYAIIAKTAINTTVTISAHLSLANLFYFLQVCCCICAVCRPRVDSSVATRYTQDAIQKLCFRQVEAILWWEDRWGWETKSDLGTPS